MTTKNQLYTVFFANDADKNPIWSIELDDIELVAGMLAGGAGIIDDLNYDSKDVTYYLDSDADVSEFRLVNSIPEEEIPENTCGKIYCDRGLQGLTFVHHGDKNVCHILGCPKSGQYGLWMHSGKKYYYSLYAFRKSSFFQGIILSLIHI